MSKTTDIRQAIAAVFEDSGHEVKVLMGPTDMQPATSGASFGGDDRPDTNFVLRIIVGPPDVASEVQIDDLVELVPARIKENKKLGGLVQHSQIRHCSGHRAYATGPGEPPRLGCEWTIKVMD